MLCTLCGEVLVDDVIPAAAKMAAHRLLRHESPGKQALAAFVLTAIGVTVWKNRA